MLIMYNIILIPFNVIYIALYKIILMIFHFLTAFEDWAQISYVGSDAGH